MRGTESQLQTMLSSVHSCLHCSAVSLAHVPHANSDGSVFSSGRVKFTCVHMFTLFLQERIHRRVLCKSADVNKVILS